MLDTPRSVREVTDHIRDLIESDSLLGDLWISGEVLEATVSRSGHVFFTLAEDGAQMSCVLFRMNALRQRTLPTLGAACVAHGHVEVYSTEGTYQFYVDLVEDAGIGLAALELELLRQQLEAEGLFSENRKRPLPTNPMTIGVITSAAGAVWHDIQNVVRRRFPLVQILMAPAAVQGESAPFTLIEALQSLVLDGRSEVIIIARGGGSASDLSAFNDENLVRAVFAAPVPVVSAIGHETDWTLLDLVADVRAPTPSAAAELVTPSIASRLNALLETLALQSVRFERQLAIQTLDLDRLTSRLDQVGPASELQSLSNRLVIMRSGLSTSVARAIDERNMQIEVAQTGLRQSERQATKRREDHLAHLSSLLQALSPTKTMERGYAFVEQSESGRPLRSANEAGVGQTIRTRVVDGSIESVVSTISTTKSTT